MFVSKFQLHTLASRGPIRRSSTTETREKFKISSQQNRSEGEEKQREKEYRSYGRDLKLESRERWKRYYEKKRELIGITKKQYKERDVTRIVEYGKKRYLKNRDKFVWDKRAYRLHRKDKAANEKRREGICKHLVTSGTKLKVWWKVVMMVIVRWLVGSSVGVFLELLSWK
eukprot:TRINITY_DN6369_c0_g1_i1.p1 TRINITY_DN6369_c0_g1~~TRINITY_DN6369_c0_g1_i1.p1  ORF type:complete len:171 (-),score=37.42 TRINITY_DN6369_c0_g1_i1:439-951(-)